jgi:hypothetical protein
MPQIKLEVIEVDGHMVVDGPTITVSGNLDDAGKLTVDRGKPGLLEMLWQEWAGPEDMEHSPAMRAGERRRTG